MKTDRLADILESKAFTNEVQADISEARALGVRRVIVVTRISIAVVSIVIV